MTIRSLQFSDIEIVIKFHKKNLTSAGSAIGYVYLEKLYRNLISNPNLHFGLLALENNKICGCITGTRDLGRTNKLLKSSLPLSVYITIIRALFSKKINIVDLINRFRLDYWVNKNCKKPYFYILGLFVEKNLRRQGIGMKLLSATLKQVKKQKTKKIYVDTLEKNRNALKFYQNNGFFILNKTSGSRILEYKII